MIKTLIFGASLCEGFGFDSKNVHVECFPGYTTEELLKLGNFGLRMLLQEDEYYQVIIIAGTNDVGLGIVNEDVLKNLSTMIDICLSNKSVKHVRILGVMVHSRIHEYFNEQLEDLCDMRTSFNMLVEYCDILENLDDKFIDVDGVHLNLAGKKYVASYFQHAL